MNLTILSLSASEQSVGRICAHALKSELLTKGYHVDLFDIRSLPPVWVDNRGLAALPAGYAAIDTAIRKSHGVVLVHPIYCYTASSPAKAITEIFGDALEKMPVGMIVSAGSVRSHLAVGHLMMSMMFEQGTVCFPKAVMATKDDLDNGVPRQELIGRISDFAIDFARFARALQAYRPAVQTQS
jgi:NAD(P)H-dependent FMN reductase